MKNINQNSADKLKIGVPYLDYALGGISNSDFMVLGAKPGAGTTELATTIALHNAAKDKKVLFVSLDSERCEIANRIKFIIFSICYHRLSDDQKPAELNGVQISAPNYYNNKIPRTFIDEEVDEIFVEKIKTLSLIEKFGPFTINDLEFALNGTNGEFDLLVIDHLNCFDFDQSVEENRAVSDVVRKIRDLSLSHKKPTVLITHVRKNDRGSKVLVPNTEDIFGPSEIVRVATKVITIAPRYVDEIAPGISPTYIRIAKCREDGAVTRYVASCNFIHSKNSYEGLFSLGTLNFNETEFEEITSLADLPYWAKPIRQ